MQVAFVTGGSGFVGRNLIEELVKSGWKVKALARSEASKKIVMELGAEPVETDLFNEKAITKGCEGCSVVFHLAANVEARGKITDHLKINVEGTRTLLKAAKEAKVGCFVLCSTEAILVDNRELIDADETYPYPENPTGPYGITKQMQEKLVLEANSEGFRTVAIRPRFIWGKGDTNMTVELAGAARSGKMKWVAGGVHLTSTVHVKNVVEGLIKGYEKGKGGETYFVTDGKPVVFKEFVSKLIATQGVDPATVGSIPLWLAKCLKNWRVIAPPEFNFFARTCTVKDDKARKELGYVGHVSREEGFAEMSQKE